MDRVTRTELPAVNTGKILWSIGCKSVTATPKAVTKRDAQRSFLHCQNALQGFESNPCECVLQKLKGETVKFLHMLIVLLALAAFAVSLFAGLSYSFSGHGLHPALAVLLGAFAALVVGWWSAGKVEDL